MNQTRKFYIVLTDAAASGDIMIALRSIPATEGVTTKGNEVWFEVPFTKDTDLTPYMDIAVESPSSVSGLFDPTGVTANA